ncbi:MAG: DEAD/DEAH box helicase [Acidobacteriota bacterium]
MNSELDIIAPQSAAIEPEEFQSTLIGNVSNMLLSDIPPPCLIRAPTGAGKTFVIARILESVTKESPTLWFWFVPFINLVQQTEDAIAGNAHSLTPVSLLRGRNQAPVGGLVVISTAQAVAKAKSRREGYTDGSDDTTRSLDAQIALARAKGLKIGLIVDEAHIGLDSQTEFGQFVHWVKPDRLVMATATPKDERLTDFMAKAGYSGFETFAVSRDDVVKARLNKRYIEAVVYDLRQSMQAVTDLQQTVLRQAWKRNLRLKARLEKLGVPVVPLLLVQVANGPTAVADARQQLMDLCGVSAAAIGEHSSDEPDPVLMASIANDTTKEVLIFKQSAGTGFDAPRAFVLASTKPVNDPDFAAQFIGRVMRVHRAIRTKFPRPTPVDIELDTAYVYLANAEAQQGFEQAVAATANLKTQLEGQTEKLVAVKMASGAVVYTNRETDTSPLFYDTKLPSGNDASESGREAKLPTSTLGSTGQLPLGHSDQEDDGLDLREDVTLKRLVFGAGTPSSNSGTKAAAPPTPPTRPKNRKDFLEALPMAGLRGYQLRKNLPKLPAALRRETRPEMADMSAASQLAATRLTISSAVQELAIATALGKVKEREIHTELTANERKEQSVFVVVARKALEREARAALRSLPQVEEEDAAIIIGTLEKRLRPAIEASADNPDGDPVDGSEIQRMCRDAAYAVIRREREKLGELLHEEIANQAAFVDAGPLPDAMLFAFDIGLEPSSKNIYGVLPPSKEDMEKLQQVLTIDARSHLEEKEIALEDGGLRLAPFDGTHALGHDERAFAKALDRASFVQWWHRNPDRKGFSVRLVRGEHKNYFYPDFIVCLEHFSGGDPMLRLVETKESLKDAARKARRASPLYGKVLFMTRDGAEWRAVNDDGTMGARIDLDDLSEMQEWLRETVPAAT